MSGFDTPFPSHVIGIWLLAVLVIAVWNHFRLRDAVGARYRTALTALRLASLLALLLLLLQPYRRMTQPDRDGFRVALLADCSNSMNVRDCEAATARLDVVRNALSRDTPDSLRARLESAYRVKTFLFSETMHADRGLELSPLPGKTALGDALERCLAEFSSIPLGGVVVLSDGHSNAGRSVPEASKPFRNRGIPVSCIGIGETRHAGDVRVRFTDETVSVVKDEPTVLKATVKNTLGDAVTAELTLSGPSAVLNKSVELEPHSGSATVSFTVTPWAAGFQMYRLRVKPVPGDSRPETDVDYIGMRVADPDVFRVLYLGAHLNWEYKFLRLVTGESEQFSLGSVIRTGKNTFYSTGLPDDESGTGFPHEPDVYNAFEAVLLDTRVLPGLSEAAVKALAGFVENRGGGLLAFGPLSDVPEAIADMLPVAPAEPHEPPRTVRLQANPNFIFDTGRTGVLHSPRGLPVAPGEPACFPTALKKGARAAVSTAAPERVGLGAQRYGSGRVAYLGFENSWRWRLASAAGKDTHDAFWQALLVWLASSSKPRITAHSDGREAGVGEPVQLDVDVLGTDFLPSPDARVSCTVTLPDGEARDLDLNPSAEQSGRYTGLLFPEQVGEYKVDYRIKLPEESREHQAHFVAKHLGDETAETDYRGDVLADLARITDGRFWKYTDIKAVASVPLSADVPLKSTRINWTRSWLLLLVAALTFGADWYCRRRIGLK